MSSTQIAISPHLYEQILKFKLFIAFVQEMHIRTCSLLATK